MLSICMTFGRLTFCEKAAQRVEQSILKRHMDVLLRPTVDVYKLLNYVWNGQILIDSFETDIRE